MIEQIRSELGNFIGWNIFPILLLVAAAKWPNVPHPRPHRQIGTASTEH